MEEITLLDIIYCCLGILGIYIIYLIVNKFLKK